ncbi:hypothetical protein [Actinoplanes sp. NPDC020271]|uniref:hypothetical protein n=1 Tax=Actinoplanes sp. NPDC020271 TaxID=3363896 RepID=UPI003793E8AF
MRRVLALLVLPSCSCSGGFVRAVSIVVDASAAGAASLPGRLGAGARFSLAAPARTRAW